MEKTYQTLKGWLRPPRQLRTTTLGKLVITFAIVIGVAATNTGNNLLYLVLGGLFGIIAASGVLSERVIKEIAVEITPPLVGMVGKASTVGLTLRASEKISSFLLDIQLADAERKPLGSTHIREIHQGQRRSVAIRIEPEKRGAWEFKSIRVATRFPFQMYEKARFFERETKIWIAPRPDEGHLTELQQLDGQVQIRQNRLSDGDEFRGLRERQLSDPMSRIHWKRSTTGDDHVVKVFASQQSPQIVVELYQGTSDHEFEKGLEQTAGIVEWVRKRQRSVKVVAGSREGMMAADASGWTQVQLLLAQVERNDVPPAKFVVDWGLAA